MEDLQVVFMIFLSLFCICHCFHSTPMPCNASLTDSCPASLYFVPLKSKTIEETAALFHVNLDVVTGAGNGFLITVNCSCPADHDVFLWHTDYMVQSGDTWGSISSEFGSLVLERPEKLLIPSNYMTLDLLCGCLKGVRIVTYVVETGDTVYTICTHFKCDVGKTEWLNKLDASALIHAVDVIFLPTTDLRHLTFDDNASKTGKKSKSRSHLAVEVIVAVSSFMAVLTTLLFCLFCYKRKQTEWSEASAGGIKHYPSFFTFVFSKSRSSSSQDLHSSSKASVENPITLFIPDKPTVFQFSEVEVSSATSNYNASKKLGQGSYGSVYHGRLRGIDVAVKQMKNTRSKEFLAELNILCKVHHKNIIKLIGYAAGGNSLFLVYEFAENGALSGHLHNPSMKGHTPLSWTARVQIALDAAKGLEYIHMYTKPYYIHRDVKTSNILLDSCFRAKIADFGLVKLLEHSPEIGAATSKIVGTFGYLAPEYVRDGFVTTKSDVYAYGVVLMELITGKPALSRTISTENNFSTEHRSLVDLILSALEDDDEPMAKLAPCIDPNLPCYHTDSLMQMAHLSKECVDDNPSRRPDMSKVIICLSLALASSKEWEAEEQIRNKHPHW